MQKLSVLGPGRWGSFLAWYAYQQGFEISLWGRENSRGMADLLKDRKNEYLILPDSIRLEQNLSRAIENADIICIAVPAQELRKLAALISQHPIENKTWVLCMKGLESESGKRLSTVFKEETGAEKVAVWAGPGHVQEFLKGHPNSMVLSSDFVGLAESLCEILGSDLIRFYHNQDLIGTEIGAAAKNVIGLAAGMLDGKDLATLKGALMARGAFEISKIVAALGGNPKTVYGLSHLGDYEATLFSPWSQNRLYGQSLVQGKTFSKLAEGVPTVKALWHLSQACNVDMPITRALYSVLFEKENPEKALTQLFLRPQKAEFGGD